MAEAEETREGLEEDSGERPSDPLDVAVESELATEPSEEGLTESDSERPTDDSDASGQDATQDAGVIPELPAELQDKYVSKSEYTKKTQEFSAQRKELEERAGLSDQYAALLRDPEILSVVQRKYGSGTQPTNGGQPTADLSKVDPEARNILDAWFQEKIAPYQTALKDVMQHSQGQKDVAAYDSLVNEYPHIADLVQTEGFSDKVAKAEKDNPGISYATAVKLASFDDSISLGEKKKTAEIKQKSLRRSEKPGVAKNTVEDTGTDDTDMAAIFKAEAKRRKTR